MDWVAISSASYITETDRYVTVVSVGYTIFVDNRRLDVPILGGGPSDLQEASRDSDYVRMLCC